MCFMTSVITPLPTSSSIWELLRSQAEAGPTQAVLIAPWSGEACSGDSGPVVTSSTWYV